MKRIRWRYMVFEIISQEELDIDKNALSEALIRSIKELWGLRGLMETSARLVYYDKMMKRGLIRCKHRYLHIVRSSLASIRELDGVKVIIRVIKVTGTRKRALELLRSYSEVA